MKTKLMFTILLLGSMLSPFSYANEKGNGGSAFQVHSNEIMLLDEIEHQYAFFPKNEEAYKTIIAPQLEVLSKKLPRVAKMIQDAFEWGATWYMIDAAKLKKIYLDKNKSPVYLISNDIQAAATENRVSRIYKPVWNSLTLEGQAYLLVHEMLWTIELSMDFAKEILGTFPIVRYDDENYEITGAKTTPKNIREMTGFILNPFLKNFPPLIIKNRIQDNTGYYCSFCDASDVLIGWFIHETSKLNRIFYLPPAHQMYTNTTFITLLAELDLYEEKGIPETKISSFYLNVDSDEKSNYNPPFFGGNNPAEKYCENKLKEQEAIDFINTKTLDHCSFWGYTKASLNYTVNETSALSTVTSRSSRRARGKRASSSYHRATVNARRGSLYFYRCTLQVETECSGYINAENLKLK